MWAGDPAGLGPICGLSVATWASAAVPEATGGDCAPATASTPASRSTLSPSATERGRSRESRRLCRGTLRLLQDVVHGLHRGFDHGLMRISRVQRRPKDMMLFAGR